MTYTLDASLSRRPLKLKSNRVWRTYTGGKMIEAWQGKVTPEDTSFPEEWVASTVKASNIGREHIHEGWSEVELEDCSQSVTLKELVELDPEAFLGKKHTELYQERLAVLVKVLDASERLTIQVHPDRETAKRFFNSDFGKTEAWLVIGGREINGELPCVYLGFKPGMTKERWKQLFEKQDIPEMLNALHRINVNQGDVFLVNGGVPHAIGAGCFLVEIQEPTDLTLRTERMTPHGLVVPDAACHQNIGFERMLDCFKYESFPLTDTLKRYKKIPRIIKTIGEEREYELIGSDDTDRFGMKQIEVRNRYEKKLEEGFVIAIILQGEGELCFGNHSMRIKQSDQLFIPAGVNETQWLNKGEETLNVVFCYPPSKI